MMPAFFPNRHKTDATVQAHADCSVTTRLRCLPLLFLVFILASTSPARGETERRQSGTANSDTQAIKDEAIQLISRLRQLEQKLLYPAHTQLSVFLSVAQDSPVEPRAISLVIDGDTVTSHVYTQKETDALRTGGIQRLFTGNTTTGKHSLSVSFDETLKGGAVRRHQVKYNFKKGSKAGLIEIILGNEQTAGQPVTIRSRN